MHALLRVSIWSPRLTYSSMCLNLSHYIYIIKTTHSYSNPYISVPISNFVDRYFPTNGGAWSGKDITFVRTPDCSSCSPGKCAPPADAPIWCGYESLKGGQPFDPEGLLSSLTAVCASLFGANIGAAVVGLSNRRVRAHFLYDCLL